MKCEICEEETDEKIQAVCGHSAPICLECQEDCADSIKVDKCLKCQQADEEGDEPSGKPVVELEGEDGNAGYIIGKCMKVARKAGWDLAKQNKVRDEMMAGDYDHLLQTAMKYFEVE